MPVGRTSGTVTVNIVKLMWILFAGACFIRKIQLVVVSGVKHFSRLSLLIDRLQMCWFLCSSWDPLGVTGSNIEKSGSKYSSWVVSQQVHF